MGRLLTLPPSPWEREHIAGVAAGVRYEAEHHALPQTPAWAMLERRYDLDPMRFARWHPNCALLIERSREALARPDVSPIDRCSPYQAECGCEQPPAHGGGAQQVVPEPAAWLMLAVGLLIAWRARG